MLPHATISDLIGYFPGRSHFNFYLIILHNFSFYLVWKKIIFFYSHCFFLNSHRLNKYITTALFKEFVLNEHGNADIFFKENGTSVSMCTNNNGKVSITGSNGRTKGVKL